MTCVRYISTYILYATSTWVKKLHTVWIGKNEIRYTYGM